jgi:hypothetical protein
MCSFTPAPFSAAAVPIACTNELGSQAQSLAAFISHQEGIEGKT